MNRPRVDDADLARMRSRFFVHGGGISEGGLVQSRFWTLLILASVIAAAGVVADSTATVIGAMIVAPLMTPILGIVVSLVLGDARNLRASIALVVAGAATAAAVGFLLGAVLPDVRIAIDNSQVAARVHPGLIDLIAALATGTVAAFAQCRSDVSDTLPGVAIAISLVPPLVVVGLMLESGQYGQAGGALLLFLTNVAAILVTGVLVMVWYRVHPAGVDMRRRALPLLAALVVLAVPLATSTVGIVAEMAADRRLREEVAAWAGPAGWAPISIVRSGGSAHVTVAGPGEPPATASLRARLDAAGISADDVRVSFSNEVVLDAG